MRISDWSSDVCSSDLISNAVKYSPSRGKIEVQVDRTHERIRVSITDHGEGIPEAFRAHIFEKFAQANWTDTNPRGGSGLGLNISRADRKSVASGKWVSVRLDIAGRAHIKKKKN